MPDPSWRPAAKAPVIRVPITREAIIDASLRILDRDGMDGLSMRRVGEELGVGAASLYWHVHNKDELLQLLFERVTEQVVLPPPDPEHWMDQVRHLAHQMRDVMNAHRDSARISLGRIPSGPTIARLGRVDVRAAAAGGPARSGDRLRRRPHGPICGRLRLRGEPGPGVTDGGGSAARADRGHVHRVPDLAARRPLPPHRRCRRPAHGRTARSPLRFRPRRHPAGPGDLRRRAEADPMGAPDGREKRLTTRRPAIQTPPDAATGRWRPPLRRCGAPV